MKSPLSRARSRRWSAVAALALALGGVPARAASLVVTHARLVDGTGAPPREDLSILVEDGRITRVGAFAPSPGAEILDATGATVLPGLIDAHVHVAMVPGAPQRGDDRDAWQALERLQLRSWLACGVTTVMDQGMPAEDLARFRRWAAEGVAGPRLLSTGPPLTRPGGHIPALVPELAWETQDEPAAIQAHLDRLVALGVDGVKVALDRSFGPDPLWSASQRAAIAAGVAKRGLPLFVHARTPALYALALKMGPRAIIHGSPVSAGLARRVAQAGVYVLPTLAIEAALFDDGEPEALTDPLLAAVVPPEELATARDPAAWRAYRSFLGAAARSRVFAPMFREPTKFRGVYAQHLAMMQAGVRRMHQAGVPLVLGSDAGAPPHAPTNFAGWLAIRELEALAAAGLPPEAVVAAATRDAARMLRLEAEVGAVAVGLRADLVALDADPLRDPRAWRRVRWSMKDGVAHTPAQWMAGDGG